MLFDRAHQRSLSEVVSKLYKEATEQLFRLRIEAFLNKAVEIVRGYLQVSHISLFEKRGERFYLRATTRRELELTGEDFRDYWFEANNSPVTNDLTEQEKCKLRHRIKPDDWFGGRASENLVRLSRENGNQDRMVALFETTKDSESLLICIGPRKQGTSNQKKSNRITYEDLDKLSQLQKHLVRLLDLCVILQNQNWLIRELVHSTNQPLQILWSKFNEFQRQVFKDSEKLFFSLEVKMCRDHIKNAFQLVHDSVDQLQFFSSFTEEKKNYQFENIRLDKLVEECCNILSIQARSKLCFIDSSQITKNIKVPIVPTALRIVTLNLLDNAMKYSFDNETIYVCIDEKKNGLIRLRVINYGIGIRDLPKNNLPIFQL